jgi:crossover junction endodeoxyribonuclease RusA
MPRRIDSNTPEVVTGEPVIFLVDGIAIAKQSTRFDGHGHAHTSARVKAWQETVAWKAREVMAGREPLSGPVAMRLVFILHNHRRVDLDNLNKAVSDALNGIVYLDDNQVVNLHLVKHVMPKAHPGVYVEVRPGCYLWPINSGEPPDDIKALRGEK